jgi:hypothetical protein
MQRKHNNGPNYSQRLTLNGAARFDKSRGSFHISSGIAQSKFKLLMDAIMQENNKKANYMLYFLHNIRYKITLLQKRNAIYTNIRNFVGAQMCPPLTPTLFSKVLSVFTVHLTQHGHHIQENCMSRLKVS